MRRVCRNEVWSHHNLMKLLCISACTSLSLLNLYLPYHWPECSSDCTWRLFWAAHKNSVQWSRMQWGVCPCSRNKPICFYKALIRILFSQSTAHTGGPGAVYRACTVGLKVCVEAHIVIYADLGPSTGEVMVPGSCLDSAGQSICYSLEQKLLCLHWSLMERSLNQWAVTAPHIKLQEKNAAWPFHKSRMHTQLWVGFRCPWWKAWPLALLIDMLLFMP